MNKTLHTLLFLLSLSYFSKLNAQCGAQASANATISCGSSHTVTASTNSVVYSVAPSSCSPVTISGTNAFPTACDDCVTGQIPLGFNFNFYGNTYNSVVISSNGLVGFGAFTFTGFTPFTIPAGGLPNNYIAGFMCDLDIRYGGTITYQMVGTAPNRRFVVRYNNVVPYNMGSAAGTGTASFQIVINENSSFQVIVSQLSANWNSSTSGALATSGAENIDGTLAFPVPGRNNTDWPGIVSSAQDCHLFNPVPCIFTNWTVGGTVVSTSTNYNISPTATTTYNANWNCGGTPCTKPVVITVAQRTLSLGTATPNTGCGTPNGIIPLNFTNVPNGNYTLTYSLNGVPTTRTITVSAGAASLTGLSAGNYSAFSIPAIAGCSAVSAAGPVAITAPTIPSGTGVTICQGAPNQAMTSSFVCSGSLQWYTAASGGSSIGTGTSFNPVGVAGSGLTNTNTAGTTTYYLACSSSPTCRTAINYVINAAPTAAVTGTNTICAGQSTTFTASGGASYRWNTGATTAPITVTPAANTTYTVTVTNAAGCTATASRTVTVNPLPTASISGTTTVCATSSTALTASGGSSYSWSTGAGTTAINVSPAANTTYTVTVSSAAGCTATANATVTVNQPSTSPSLNAAGTICPNTTVLMTASGGTSGTGAQVGWYTGPNGTGTFLGFGNSFNWTPTATSTIYARREGACNNTSDATSTVTVRNYVYASNGTSSSTYCTDNAGWHHFYNGNNIILSVQGDLSNAGTVTATIRDNGAYYLDPGNTANCAFGNTPGEAQFEMERNWNVQHTGSLSGTYNVRYYFDPAERTAVINAANNWMATYAACGYNYKYNAGSNGWFWFKNQGSSYTAPDFDDDPSFLMLTSSGSGTTPDGITWATMSGVTNFSGGTGGIILVPSSLLPVEWLYFSGNTVDRINKLQWATASEENTREFEVQRSKDGINFEVIGNVQAAGNSNIQNNYLFDDVNPYSGLNYYRLRLINNDNSAEFSETIVLEINERDLNASIYPNPATDEITYSFNGQVDEDVRIVLIDALGRVLRERIVRSGVGINNLKTDLRDLVPAAYNLRITHLQSGKDFSKKIIKK